MEEAEVAAVAGSWAWAAPGAAQTLDYQPMRAAELSARAMRSAVLAEVAETPGALGKLASVSPPPEWEDLPGVVSNAKHAEALKIYPDPRQVLGPLYDGEFFERDAAA